MKITTRLSNGILGASLILVLYSAMTNAQTPDGETPANEGVCDQLVGGTPGLYGLCVAYCEAQDHTDAVPSDPPARKILDVYNKRRKIGDPEMPCIQAPCPCWSEDDLDVTMPTLTACVDFIGDPQLQVDALTISGPAPSSLNAARFSVNNTSATIDHCLFVVQQSGLPNSGISRILTITKEDGEICEASIRDHAASLGVPCVTP